MARPKGFRLHQPSLALWCKERRFSLTEAAEELGLGLTTLSGLAKGNHGASITTVRMVEGRVGTEVTHALFPEFEGLFSNAAPFRPAKAAA